MSHLDYLRSIYDFSGRTVADIGAGDGTYSKQLHQAGAEVIAIEVDTAKVETARKNLPDDIKMKVGKAEDLPIATGSIDLACFFFSFHHVPMDVQSLALEEVKRILRPAARLHVVEPFPYGSMFEVVRHVEDETEVRTNSHNILSHLGVRGDFKLVATSKYVLDREYPDFDYLVSKIVSPDSNRAAIFPSVRDEMEQTYLSLISEQPGKHVLHQPCAAYHFEIAT
jgi:ubiquinone/menaquinone biosynthesis C-methylase UbiE